MIVIAAEWSVAGAPGSPIRSIVPLAVTSPVSGTTSWYFSDEEPALRTSTGDVG